MKLLLLVALASVTTADKATAEEERQLAAGLGTLLGALAGNQLAGTDPLTSLLAGAAGGAAGNAAGSIAGNLAGNLLSGGKGKGLLGGKGKGKSSEVFGGLFGGGKAPRKQLATKAARKSAPATGGVKK